MLINMGGLQNPFWSLDDAALYAQKMIAALRRILPQDEAIEITTSSAVSEKVGENACVYSRAQMRNILATTRYAFMTPGLGNIYDAAVFDIPTIWLPPANDSQGQQLSMLAQHGMTDGAVDWGIDCFDDQPSVLAAITRQVRQVTVDQLVQYLSKQLPLIDEHKPSKTRALIEQFGCNGDVVVAEQLHSFVLNRHDQGKDRRYA